MAVNVANVFFPNVRKEEKDRREGQRCAPVALPAITWPSCSTSHWSSTLVTSGLLDWSARLGKTHAGQGRDSWVKILGYGALGHVEPSLPGRRTTYMLHVLPPKKRRLWVWEAVYAIVRPSYQATTHLSPADFEGEPRTRICSRPRPASVTSMPRLDDLAP